MFKNIPIDSSSGNIKEFSGTDFQMKFSLALNQRKVFLYDSVRENSIFECIYYLNKLMYIDNMYGTKEPIEILINSNGGSVYDCLTLVSLIEHMKDIGYKIITTNIGRAFSAGFILSIIGSERRSYRFSSYMTHDISTFMYGKLQEIKEDTEEMERLKQLLNEIISKYTKITLKELEKWQERKLDKFFNTKEAFKLGITDIIL